MNKLGTVGTTELWGDGTSHELRTNVGDGKALVSLLAPPVVTPPPPTSPVVIPATTHRVATVAEFNAAQKAAKPGDVVLVTANPGGRLLWDGTNGGASGLPGKHIKVRTNTGIVLDAGNPRNGSDAFATYVVKHVDADIAVTRCQYGVRLFGTEGTSDSPIKLKVRVSNTGQGGLKIGAQNTNATGSSPPGTVPLYCRYIDVEDSTVSGVEAGEGIYLGTGDPNWWDTTSNINIRRTQVSNTRGADGIDIKPLVRYVAVEDCLVWDIDPGDGAAITANLSWVRPSPFLATPANVTLRNNRIWNINTPNRPDRNSIAIWSGGGGVHLIDNKVWNVGTGRGSAITVWAPYQMGATLVNDVTNNVVLNPTGISREGFPGVVRFSGNSGLAGAPNIQNARTEAELRALIG